MPWIDPCTHVRVCESHFLSMRFLDIQQQNQTMAGRTVCQACMLSELPWPTLHMQTLHIYGKPLVTFVHAGVGVQLLQHKIQ